MKTKEFNGAHTKTWRGRDSRGRIHTLRASISPCSHMYPSHGLQIRISLDEDESNGGCLFRRSATPWDACGIADFEALLADPVVIDPCSREGCAGCRIKGSRADKPGFPGTTLCESCYLADLSVEWDAEQEKEAKRDARRIKKLITQGFTHRAIAWVHPVVGDDYQIELASKGKPSVSSIKAALRACHSRTLTDYTIQSLDSVGAAK